MDRTSPPLLSRQRRTRNREAVIALARSARRRQRRAFVLHGICSTVAGLLACGIDRHEAFRICLAQYKGCVTCSTKSLYRYFDRWSKAPWPAVFAPGYKGGRARVSAADVRAFLSIARRPGTRNITDAYDCFLREKKQNRATPPPFCYRTATRIVGAHQLNKLFRVRAAARKVESEAANVIASLGLRQRIVIAK